ncbi:hypothetical protein SAMN04488603_10981 [Paenibacillus sp. cl130]|nr:hypothetical protein SAMN04488603_10981 [Paenibacillus sp. cl130]
MKGAAKQLIYSWFATPLLVVRTEIYSYFMLFTTSTYYLRQSIEISSVLFNNLDTTEKTIDSYSKLRKENASDIDFYVMHLRDDHVDDFLERSLLIF